MSDLTQLTADSTLGDLPLHDFQVSPATLGKVLANQFQKRPDLPGAIVADELRMLGMISRRKFNDWMSSPYGLDIFLDSPLEMFLNVIKQNEDFLQLPDTEPVDRAVEMAISRTGEDIYEPIIIVFEDHNIPGFQVSFLLDFPTLLRAQLQISLAVKEERNRRRTKSDYALKLEREKRKIKEYRKVLNGQKAVIQERHQFLEGQQAELAQRSEEIEKLNRGFRQIGHLVSHQGKIAFRGTFSGVNIILNNTMDIVDVSRCLSEELEKIQTTSQLIKTVSQQIRHLALKGAILANNGGAELKGFSQISSEIGKLIGQTFEAGRQMDRDANRLMFKIQEFTDSAHTGMRVARSIIKKIDQAKMAIEQLETIVKNPDLEIDFTSQSISEVAVVNDIDWSEPVERISGRSQALVEKIALAEATMYGLQERTKYKNSGLLIQKIERVLKKYKPLNLN